MRSIEKKRNDLINNELTSPHTVSMLIFANFNAREYIDKKKTLEH